MTPHQQQENISGGQMTEDSAGPANPCTGILTSPHITCSNAATALAASRAKNGMLLAACEKLCLRQLSSDCVDDRRAALRKAVGIAEACEQAVAEQWERIFQARFAAGVAGGTAADDAAAAPRGQRQLTTGLTRSSCRTASPLTASIATVAALSAAEAKHSVLCNALEDIGLGVLTRYSGGGNGNSSSSSSSSSSSTGSGCGAGLGETPRHNGDGGKADGDDNRTRSDGHDGSSPLHQMDSSGDAPATDGDAVRKIGSGCGDTSAAAEIACLKELPDARHARFRELLGIFRASEAAATDVYRAALERQLHISGQLGESARKGSSDQHLQDAMSPLATSPVTTSPLATSPPASSSPAASASTTAAEGPACRRASSGARPDSFPFYDQHFYQGTAPEAPELTYDCITGRFVPTCTPTAATASHRCQCGRSLHPCQVSQGAHGGGDVSSSKRHLHSAASSAASSPAGGTAAASGSLARRTSSDVRVDSFPFYDQQFYQGTAPEAPELTYDRITGRFVPTAVSTAATASHLCHCGRSLHPLLVSKCVHKGDVSSSKRHLHSAASPAATSPPATSPAGGTAAASGSLARRTSSDVRVDSFPFYDQQFYQGTAPEAPELTYDRITGRFVPTAVSTAATASHRCQCGRSLHPSQVSQGAHGGDVSSSKRHLHSAASPATTSPAATSPAGGTAAASGSLAGRTSSDVRVDSFPFYDQHFYQGTAPEAPELTYDRITGRFVPSAVSTTATASHRCHCGRTPA